MTRFSQLKKQYWLQQNSNALPAGYTRYEKFLVADGGYSYVDTGLTHSTDDEWLMYCSNIKNANSGVVGSSESKTAGNFSLWLHGESGAAHNRVDFIFGNGSDTNYQLQTQDYDVTQSHLYRMKLSTGEAWIDGDYIGKSVRLGTVSSPKKLVFCGCWRGNNIIGAAPHCYVRQYRIIRGGVLIRNYVPCKRDADDQAGFYDLCGSTSGDAGTSFYMTQDGRGTVDGILS